MIELLRHYSNRAGLLEQLHRVAVILPDDPRDDETDTRDQQEERGPLARQSATSDGLVVYVHRCRTTCGLVTVLRKPVSAHRRRSGPSRQSDLGPGRQLEARAVGC